MADPKPLTEEQAQHWRKLLLPKIGPYALIMPLEDIEQERAKVQAMVNYICDEPESKE